MAASDLDRRDRWTEHRQVSTDADMQKLQLSIIDEMRTELSNKDVDRLVVSSEHIQSALTRVSEIKRLKQILADLGVTRFSVIVYFRDPVELVGSLYSTAIKSGSTAPEPPLPDSTYKQICDHRTTVENFTQVFTAEDSELIIRIFERSELKNGSVLDDFLSILGIESLEGFNKPKKENKSLSPLGIALLRRVNEDIPNLNEDAAVAMRKKVIEKFDNYFTNEKYTVPEYLTQAYAEAFESSNEWLRLNYFKDKPHLFKKRQAKAPSQIVVEHNDLDKVSQLFVKAWKS